MKKFVLNMLSDSNDVSHKRENRIFETCLDNCAYRVFSRDCQSIKPKNMVF